MDMKLSINQSVERIVLARQQWNATGIHLQAGHAYRIEGSGRWRDAFICSGPEGFNRWFMRWADHKKQVPNANWFALIGTYDGTDPFVIGDMIPSFEAQKTGELICFANDAEGYYWNNFGSVTIKITRLY